MGASSGLLRGPPRRRSTGKPALEPVAPHLLKSAALHSAIGESPKLPSRALADQRRSLGCSTISESPSGAPRSAIREEADQNAAMSWPRDETPALRSSCVT